MNWYFESNGPSAFQIVTYAGFCLAAGVVVWLLFNVNKLKL